MNKTVNKFLLAGDKFMPKMHLKQTGFTHLKNELDKACFQHEMASGDFKDLGKRTASDKVLRDKAFLNMMVIKEGLLLWFNKKIKSQKEVVSLIMR